MIPDPTRQSRPAPHVAIVGAGPAGLIAAEHLAAKGARVTLYDRMPSAGRKFLMAGRGGLNLTHGEPLPRFLARYGDAAPDLGPAIKRFTPDAMRAWCEGLGQPTFVGSSGRVFPVAMKASPLLRAWLARLGAQGVEIATRHRWTGFGPDGALAFETPSGEVCVRPDAAILALGGASWPRLGSDGAWTRVLDAEGIRVGPLRPANVGVRVAWSEIFRTRHEGEPLKRVALTFEGETHRGEAMVTRDGLEGGLIYAISGRLRDTMDRDGSATIRLDLRPDLDLAAVARLLDRPRAKQSTSTFLRRSAGLSAAAIGLVREAQRETHGLALPQDPLRLAGLVKEVPVRLAGTMPIARAISSAGGVAFDELDARLMLRRRPGLFVAGEMLDWEAPTGGYLLQGCFATGIAAAGGALDWLAGTPHRADESRPAAE